MSKKGHWFDDHEFQDEDKIFPDEFQFFFSLVFLDIVAVILQFL
jgi:hypothetical protein